MQEVVSESRFAYELWNARTEADRERVRRTYRTLDDEEDFRPIDFLSSREP